MSRLRTIAWLIFLVLTLLTIGLFGFSQPQELKVDRFAALDWYMSQIRKVDNVGNEQRDKVVIAARSWDQRLNIDSQWLSGASRYVALTDPDYAWDPPPAGRIVTGPVAEPHFPQLYLITVTTERLLSVTDNASYTLEIQTIGKTKEHQIPFSKLHLGPLPHGTGMRMLIRRRTSGGWFSGATNRVYSSSERYEVDAGITVVSFSSVANEVMKIKLTAEVAQLNQRADSSADAPTIIEAGRSYPAIGEGEVSLQQLNSTDHFVIKRSGANTAAVVVATSPIADQLQCRRNDNDKRVGTFHTSLPVFAVTTDRWSSLKCVVTTTRFDEPIIYKVIALSGNDFIYKQLVLELIGRHIVELEVNGVPVSGSEVVDAVNWLKASFAVEFDSEDLESVQDETGKELISRMRQHFN